MLKIKAGLPEPSKPKWPVLPPGARDAIRAKLLPRAMSGSIVQLQLRTVLMSWPMSPQGVIGTTHDKIRVTY